MNAETILNTLPGTVYKDDSPYQLTIYKTEDDQYNITYWNTDGHDRQLILCEVQSPSFYQALLSTYRLVKKYVRTIDE